MPKNVLNASRVIKAAQFYVRAYHKIDVVADFEFFITPWRPFHDYAISHDDYGMILPWLNRGESKSPLPCHVIAWSKSEISLLQLDFVFHGKNLWKLYTTVKASCIFNFTCILWKFVKKSVRQLTNSFKTSMQTQLVLEAYTRPKKWHGMLCKKRLVLVTNFIRKTTILPWKF